MKNFVANINDISFLDTSRTRKFPFKKKFIYIFYIYNLYLVVYMREEIILL